MSAFTIAITLCFGVHLCSETTSHKNGNFRCFGYCSIILQYCIKQTHLKQDWIQFWKRCDGKWVAAQRAALPEQASAESQIPRAGKRQQDWIFSSCLQFAMKIKCNTLQIMQPSAGSSRAVPELHEEAQGTQRVGEAGAVLCAELRGNTPGCRLLSKSSFCRSHKPFWLSTHLQRREELFQNSRNELFLIPCYVVDNWRRAGAKDLGQVLFFNRLNILQQAAEQTPCGSRQSFWAQSFTH